MPRNVSWTSLLGQCSPMLAFTHVLALCHFSPTAPYSSYSSKQQLADIRRSITWSHEQFSDRSCSAVTSYAPQHEHYSEQDNYKQQLEGKGRTRVIPRSHPQRQDRKSRTTGLPSQQRRTVDMVVYVFANIKEDLVMILQTMRFCGGEELVSC